MNMKKFLIFIGGFVAGILATIFTIYVIAIANKPKDDGLIGLTIFEEEGECIFTEGEIEVFQVLRPNMALAYSGSYVDRLVVLLVSYEDEGYYDGQKINISTSECARQIGVYRYTTREGRTEKTVPTVVIDTNNLTGSKQSSRGGRNAQESQQSLGNLKNTRWSYFDSNFVGSDLITVEESIEFGNGNYVFNSETNKNNRNQARVTEIGTYRVSGDNVILTSSEGKEKKGIIIGSSLTIDGRTYR